MKRDIPDEEWKAHVAERRQLMDGLDFPKDWEWADPDTIMLFACMKALDFYVYESGGIESLEEFTKELQEEEDNLKENEFLKGSTLAQINIQSEAASIWRYWHEERPKLEAKADAELHFFYGCGDDVAPRDEKNELYRPEDVERYIEFDALWDSIVERKDDEALERLLKIRGGLWT